MTETDKLSSLEEAISYPVYNEIKGLTTINVTEFSYEEIKEKLLGQGMESLEGEKLALIDEMIKLLASNKKKYHILSSFLDHQLVEKAPSLSNSSPASKNKYK